MKSYVFNLLAVAVLASPLTLTGGHAATLPGINDPQARGLAIANISDETNLGYGDTKTELRMVLTNANGQVSERRMRFNTLENKNTADGDWNLMVFDEPRDVKGTAMLTYSHILEPDEQWMFLPALKRVKRISSVNKSGPFMGSEFAFEDFSGQEVGKYSYLWLRDEVCGDRQCHVVERRPLYKHSGYTRSIAWTDTQDYQIRKVVYYDRKDALLKTLTFSKYKKYLDKYWRSHDLFMENHVTGKQTRLVWENITFRNGLSEKDFSQNSLKRAR